MATTWKVHHAIKLLRTEQRLGLGTQNGILDQRIRHVAFLTGKNNFQIDLTF